MQQTWRLAHLTPASRASSPMYWAYGDVGGMYSIVAVVYYMYSCCRRTLSFKSRKSRAADTKDPRIQVAAMRRRDYLPLCLPPPYTTC